MQTALFSRICVFREHARSRRGFARIIQAAGLVGAQLCAAGCGAGDTSSSDEGRPSEPSASERTGAAADALNTCPKKSYLCGNDGLNGSSDDLYLCGGPGQTPELVKTCPNGCTIVDNANDVCLRASSPVELSAGNRNVLGSGNYDASGWLKWTGSGGLLGGERLEANHKTSVSLGRDATLGTRLSDPGGLYPGECVSLVKALASRVVSKTSDWRRGANVLQAQNIAEGTAVATFSGNGGTTFVSGSDHVGYLAGYTSDGKAFYLWDQNFGGPYVRKHALSSGGSGKSNPKAYYVLLVP